MEDIYTIFFLTDGVTGIGRVNLMRNFLKFIIVIISIIDIDIIVRKAFV